LDVGSHFLEAGAAVFCTGYEMLAGVPSRGMKITSSWAVATAPRADYPGGLDRTLVWEAATPYLYIRTDTRGHLIVGGEDADLDSPSYRAETLNLKAARLADKTRRLLPGVKPQWTHMWAGAFGESADGLPVIDAVPDMPNYFTVMALAATARSIP
jgi:glycine/D-amino acid oxidase-like deaminating enzyme